jgi:hypothetical protein
MVRPDSALVSIGADQNTTVVHDALHRLVRRDSRTPRLSRRRAAASSRAESAPCSASHSATAARPSRMRRARRAAAVSQAETLTPSASAALRTSAWTSESTVIASLTAGLPRGTQNHTTAVASFQGRPARPHEPPHFVHPTRRDCLEPRLPVALGYLSKLSPQVTRQNTLRNGLHPIRVRVRAFIARHGRRRPTLRPRCRASKSSRPAPCSRRACLSSPTFPGVGLHVRCARPTFAEAA